MLCSVRMRVVPAVRYENDWNGVGNVGLFVTPRVVPGLTPYFSSEVCRAYVNLEHVSFGVYG